MRREHTVCDKVGEAVDSVEDDTAYSQPSVSYRAPSIEQFPSHQSKSDNPIISCIPRVPRSKRTGNEEGPHRLSYNSVQRGVSASPLSASHEQGRVLTDRSGPFSAKELGHERHCSWGVWWGNWVEGWFSTYRGWWDVVKLFRLLRNSGWGSDFRVGKNYEMNKMSHKRKLAIKCV